MYSKAGAAGAVCKVGNGHMIIIEQFDYMYSSFHTALYTHFRFLNIKYESIAKSISVIV